MFMYWKNQYYQNTLLPKAMYRFNAIPIKLSMAFFTELEQQQQQKFKIVGRHKRSQTTKAILKKKMELKESGSLI